MILKAVIIYLCAVAVLSLAATVHDKRAAQKSKRRLSERTLILLSVFGGSAAMYLTLRIIHHKTRHAKFMVGIPVIMLLQLAAVIVAANIFLNI